MKLDTVRWLNLMPGDSIIEHCDRQTADRFAASMEKQGFRFEVTPLPVERPLLITLTSIRTTRTKDDAPKA